jgi:ATP-dependent DNA ligase
MVLPIKIPFAPMEAEPVREIPEGEEWQYEPKWDGFRCLVFRDNEKVELQSKAGQPLGRYFPELIEIISRVKAKRFVLDGEILIPVSDGFSFDDLLLRIHPAKSRIEKLSKETPAIFVLFDLLVDEAGSSIKELPLEMRRKALEKFYKKNVTDSSIKLSPATSSIDVAREWLFGKDVGLDGIIAKRTNLPYQSELRTGMQKIKNMRTADCVVGGFRYSTNGKSIGSLLLGLYDSEGLLNHVGFTSSLSAKEKLGLREKLEKLIKPPGFTGKAPGGPSRWATERSTEWQPLSPKLVVEVQYDHFTGGRFRHGTKLIRWRKEKSPKQCTYDQLEK